MQTFKNDLSIAPSCTQCSPYSVAYSLKHTCRCVDNTYRTGHCMPYGMEYPWGLRSDWTHVFIKKALGRPGVDIPINSTNYEDILARVFADTDVVEWTTLHCPSMLTGGQHVFVWAQEPSEESQNFYVYCHPYAYDECLASHFATLGTNTTFTAVLRPSKTCSSDECLHPLQPDDSGQCMCAPGYGVESTAQECRLCPAGMYSNITDLEACLPCPSGTVHPGSGGLACEPCQRGMASY